MVNFNWPYSAKSISEFWRRWHISLGNWMREYLYIPLGGNRVSKWRLYFNLWLVFLLSGLWHGAAWGFIIWGAYHGAFLIMERVFLKKWLDKLGKVAFIYTFLVVMVGWVFFRTEHLAPALNFLKTMFSWHPDDEYWRPDIEYIFTVALAFFFSFFTITKPGERIQKKIFFSNHNLKQHFAMVFAGLILCILCAGRITQSSFNPFIYFRF